MLRVYQPKGEAEVSDGQAQRSWLAEILKCDATDVALQLLPAMRALENSIGSLALLLTPEC